MGSIAGKILIGVATAAVWFALSHAARAEQVCDNGTCIAKCMDIGVPGGVDFGR